VLSEAGIDDEDPPTVEFVVRKGDPPVDLNLAVRWRDKAFLVPPVKSTITVAELKETAAAKLGTHISPYSASDLRFYHFGRTLYEAARLCDAGIANQATLNLLLKARPWPPPFPSRIPAAFLPPSPFASWSPTWSATCTALTTCRLPASSPRLMSMPGLLSTFVLVFSVPGHGVMGAQEGVKEDARPKPSTPPSTGARPPIVTKRVRLRFGSAPPVELDIDPTELVVTAHERLARERVSAGVGAGLHRQ